MSEDRRRFLREMTTFSRRSLLLALNLPLTNNPRWETGGIDSEVRRIEEGLTKINSQKLREVYRKFPGLDSRAGGHIRRRSPVRGASVHEVPPPSMTARSFSRQGQAARPSHPTGQAASRPSLPLLTEPRSPRWATRPERGRQPEVLREAGTSRDRHHRQTLQVLQHGLENLLNDTLTASRVVAPNTTPVVVTPPPQRGVTGQETTPLLLRRVQEILTRNQLDQVEMSLIPTPRRRNSFGGSPSIPPLPRGVPPPPPPPPRGVPRAVPAPPAAASQLMPRRMSISGGDRDGGAAVCQANEQVERECKICFEQQLDCVLLPCGHACCCYECGIRVKFSSLGGLGRCPICRVGIKSVTQIFWS